MELQASAKLALKMTITRADGRIEVIKKEIKEENTKEEKDG